MFSSFSEALRVRVRSVPLGAVSDNRSEKVLGATGKSAQVLSGGTTEGDAPGSAC